MVPWSRCVRRHIMADVQSGKRSSLAALSASAMTDFLRSDLKGSWKVPDQRALDSLSTKLKILKAHVENTRGPWRTHDKAAISAAESLKSAVVHLQTLMQESGVQSRILEAAAAKMPELKPFIGRKERRLREIISVIEVFVSDPAILPMEAKLSEANIPLVDTWRGCVEAVAVECAKTLATVNGLKRAAGMSAGGPLARFVAATIPHITGETPTPGNINEHLVTTRWRKPVEV